MRRTLAALTAAAGLTLAACGGNDDAPGLGYGHSAREHAIEIGLCDDPVEVGATTAGCESAAGKVGLTSFASESSGNNITAMVRDSNPSGCFVRAEGFVLGADDRDAIEELVGDLDDFVEKYDATAYC